MPVDSRRRKRPERPQIITASRGDDKAELLYNYSQIPDENRLRVTEAAHAIKFHGKRTLEHTLAIGKELATVRDLLPNRQFSDWISKEFGMGKRTAYNLISTHERFGELPALQERFAQIAPSTVYLLAAPSTPEPVLDAVVSMIDSGASPTLVDVKRIIADHAPASQPEEDPASQPEDWITVRLPRSAALALHAHSHIGSSVRFLPILERERIHAALDAALGPLEGDPFDYVAREKKA